MDTQFYCWDLRCETLIAKRDSFAPMYEMKFGSVVLRNVFHPVDSPTGCKLWDSLFTSAFAFVVNVSSSMISCATSFILFQKILLIIKYKPYVLPTRKFDHSDKVTSHTVTFLCISVKYSAPILTFCREVLYAGICTKSVWMCSLMGFSGFTETFLTTADKTTSNCP